MGDEVVAALHCTLLHFLLKFPCIGNGRFMKVYALEEVQCESCSGVFEIKGLTERLLDNEEALLVPLFSVTIQAAWLVILEQREEKQVRSLSTQNKQLFSSIVGCSSRSTFP